MCQTQQALYCGKSSSERRFLKMLRVNPPAPCRNPGHFLGSFSLCLGVISLTVCLRRWNSHGRNSTSLQSCGIQRIPSVHQPPLLPSPRASSPPQKAPLPLGSHLRAPWQPRLCFLRLWTFHTDGIKQHMPFCVWVFSLSITCSRLVLVASGTYFFMVK